jgi:hypothetical protein
LWEDLLRKLAGTQFFNESIVYTDYLMLALPTNHARTLCSVFSIAWESLAFSTR